jgi:hypothetical protein
MSYTHTYVTTGYTIGVQFGSRTRPTAVATNQRTEVRMLASGSKFVAHTIVDLHLYETDVGFFELARSVAGLVPQLRALRDRPVVACCGGATPMAALRAALTATDLYGHALAVNCGLTDLLPVEKRQLAELVDAIAQDVDRLEITEPHPLAQQLVRELDEFRSRLRTGEFDTAEQDLALAAAYAMWTAEYRAAGELIIA